MRLLIHGTFHPLSEPTCKAEPLRAQGCNALFRDGDTAMLTSATLLAPLARVGHWPLHAVHPLPAAVQRVFRAMKNAQK